MGSQPFRAAVIAAVYNEEKHLAGLLEALLTQTHPPHEIILIDDGSTDSTPALLQSFAARDARVRILTQKNKGPAAARNLGWRESSSEICVFTDGDCVPESDWLEKLLTPFADERFGAAGGTYKTLNGSSLLARFIGLEIAWRHSRAGNTVDAHGAYNLAVRRSVLSETGGFREFYKKPSGEDWDLTYRISERTRIAFVREAVVGHYHPEQFWAYMKNQCRRGFDRMLVYRDHPRKKTGDTYTGSFAKYQVLGAGALLFSLLFLPSFIPGVTLLRALSLAAVLAGSFAAFPFILPRDPAAACLGAGVSFVRSFFWFAGAAAGTLRFYFRHQDEDA